MTAEERPTAWSSGRAPVRVGPRPAGVVVLGELGEPSTAASALERLRAPGRSPRRAAMALLRHGVTTLADVALAPVVVDGRRIVASVDAVGFEPDDEGEVAASWIGDGATLDVGARAELPRLGREIGAVLTSVVDVVGRIAGIGRGFGTEVVLDRLAASCDRLARCSGTVGAGSWVGPFLVATGLGDATSVRRITVRPDRGTPVELVVPRHCCAGHRRPRDSACPMCPAHPGDVARRALSEAWLRSLDDDDATWVLGRRLDPT